ncbi:hypothetical protein L226DRAFT_576935 [Lentinus tigrinus ALCF2SS1-7]|uniref:uncharacterized protein n=1 Tax=Lentinus tigrinus ALCF2SS1-7 TaxID=1328758 RepID=UPI0011663CF2|nr:hypothetical protein L226DRAFT_576935 [Lentinus tigrinus ALCF2SS1-7]
MNVLPAPAHAQVLARFALWTKNGNVPLWRMVPFVPGQPLRLRDLAWLVRACDNILFTHVEQQDNGMWRTVRLDMDELVLHESSDDQLLRLGGVDHCRLLGLELEDLERRWGLTRPPICPIVHDNRTTSWIRDVRVVVWNKDGEPPVMHRINFNDDNTLQLGIHSPLDAELHPWGIVEIWLAGDGEWSVVSIGNSFHLDAKYDTILVRIPGITLMPGFGREMNSLEAARDSNVGPKSAEIVEEAMWQGCPMIELEELMSQSDLAASL